MSTATRVVPGGAPALNPSNIGSLAGIFSPKSIAVIHADDGPTAIGEKTLGTVMSSNFRGPTFVVRGGNTSTSEQPVYATVSAAPGKVDLAIVIASPHSAPEIVGESLQRESKESCSSPAGSGSPASPAQTVRMHCSVCGPF